jgi:hypothetical protein
MGFFGGAYIVINYNNITNNSKQYETTDDLERNLLSETQPSYQSYKSASS